VIQNFEEGRRIAPHYANASEALLDEVDLVFDDAANPFTSLIITPKDMIHLRALDSGDLVSRKTLRLRVEDRAVQF